MKTIILDATTKSLEARLSSAPATTNPDFLTSWADNNGTTFTEGSSDGALNNSTAVTIAAAPASSTRRIIKAVTIQNRDTAPVTVIRNWSNKDNRFNRSYWIHWLYWFWSNWTHGLHGSCRSDWLHGIHGLYGSWNKPHSYGGSRRRRIYWNHRSNDRRRKPNRR